LVTPQDFLRLTQPPYRLISGFETLVGRLGQAPLFGRPGLNNSYTQP